MRSFNARPASAGIYAVVSKFDSDSSNPRENTFVLKYATRVWTDKCLSSRNCSLIRGLKPSPDCVQNCSVFRFPRRQHFGHTCLWQRDGRQEPTTMTDAWYEAYKTAVLETDWTKMGERLQSAEGAIKQRQQPPCSPWTTAEHRKKDKPSPTR